MSSISTYSFPKIRQNTRKSTKLLIISTSHFAKIPQKTTQYYQRRINEYKILFSKNKKKFQKSKIKFYTRLLVASIINFPINFYQFLSLFPTFSSLFAENKQKKQDFHAVSSISTYSLAKIRQKTRKIQKKWRKNADKISNQIFYLHFCAIFSVFSVFFAEFSRENKWKLRTPRENPTFSTYFPRKVRKMLGKVIEIDRN